ncbi:hypothetical protein QQ008_25335 [Fulvivirgaceae bacterium BMA10]|uniref:Uncharacterized protein n=1 Tax=Splendidivirga corallicola TaxID=3051826 RepID=A0ABT8KVC9_9BACT|nr:hypothetical protein [Fulvivirgaceae bacterium BMA10]
MNGCLVTQLLRVMVEDCQMTSDNPKLKKRRYERREVATVKLDATF